MAALRSQHTRSHRLGDKKPSGCQNDSVGLEGATGVRLELHMHMGTRTLAGILVTDGTQPGKETVDCAVAKDWCYR